MFHRHLHADLAPDSYTRRFLRKLWRYPDQLRLKGSVIPAILPIVLATALYTYLIAKAYLDWGYTNIAISNSIVPVLSVVLGLLLAFRANTSYARYYEGRQLWQDLNSNIRNLSRLVWCSIPERTQNDHLEKMRCMKLLLAFAVATKHHLRKEYGCDYFDLDYLLPPNWVPAAADDMDQYGKTNDRDTNGKGTNRNIPPETGADTDGTGATSTSSMASTSTVTHNDSADKKPLIRSMTHRQGSSSTDRGPGNSPGPLDSSHGDDPNDLANKRDRRPAHQRKFVCDEDLPDDGFTEMSLPLEILFRMGLYMAQAKTAGKIDGIFSGNIISHLNALNDCLAGLERIVSTPIPKAYTIHLKQCIFLYMMALPFTLISALEWWIIPTVLLSSFTMFGIDAIGAQIENPFGYNTNDLPLNQFCDSLRKEIEFTVYHLPCEVTDALMVGTQVL
ncbi:Bestrophin, RFP-TM, chloride channel-domain-containing protein [Spinellus fusiger]|nr:Bestrophin, RFP-TM, chloride channel-domain-containing protein [Spinellus fusiger]